MGMLRAKEARARQLSVSKPLIEMALQPQVARTTMSRVAGTGRVPGNLGEKYIDAPRACCQAAVLA